MSLWQTFSRDKCLARYSVDQQQGMTGEPRASTGDEVGRNKSPMSHPSPNPDLQGGGYFPYNAMIRTIKGNLWCFMSSHRQGVLFLLEVMYDNGW